MKDENEDLTPKSVIEDMNNSPSFQYLSSVLGSQSLREQRFRMIGFTLIAVAVVTVYLSAVYGRNVNPNLYRWMWAALPLGLCAYLSLKAAGNIRVLESLKEQWGQPIKKKRKFEELISLFTTINETPGESYHLDDRTWSDLNMEAMYSEIDRTLSNPGEQCLYRILRAPLTDRSTINERIRVIKVIQSNPELREELQLALYPLGRVDMNRLPKMLWGELPKPTAYLPLFNILSALALIAPLSIPFVGSSAASLTALLFFINMGIHYAINTKISHQVSQMRGLAALVRCGARLGSIKNKGLEAMLESIKKISAASSPIARKGGMIVSGAAMAGDIGVIIEYLSMYLLIDVRSFYGAIKDIRQNIEELKELYLKVGELDALTAAASYRTSLDESYIEPEFVEGSRGIQAEELRHPLVEDCVPNSITVDGDGITITGSNMSGKSTFLRTVGVNAVLAQTIGTCLAVSYRSGLLKIASSLSRSDDLEGGKSYYLAEAELLLNMVKEAEVGQPSLFMIDEILRGTNSIERISASVEILRYLASKKAAVIVSTHDLELTEMLKDTYRLYHFSESMGESGLTFDYRLKEGVSTTRNAIKLLAHIGFPKEVTAGAEERARSMTR